MQTHIEDCLNICEEKKWDGLYGSVIVHNGSNPIEVKASHKKENETMVTYLLRMGFGACTSTLFMTRESALDILWDEDLKRHQDYDFVIRYDKKYTLGVKEKPSVVYDSYKPTNKEAKIDFPSCISFIEKNKSDIQIETYRRYITHMFHLAGHLKAEEIILSYYKDELANLAVEESEINMEKFKDYNFNCQVEIVN